MIPNGTRFIGIAPEVDLKERGSALLNKRTEPYTIDDIRGYKVFTALLTQSGESNNSYISSDDTKPLVVGVTYTFTLNDGTGDFTNIGAPNNNVGTSFVATGTTPANWGTPGDVEVTYNTGAPVATVLENTIGNIWFSYESGGIYLMNSNGLLPNYKTWGVSDAAFDNANVINVPVFIDVNGYGPDQLYIKIQGGDFNGDSMLVNTPIEIRVYN